jgi:hypothetical protein
VTQRPLPEAALRLRQMLRDPQSLRVAFLLREVLDPPIAQRPPRRPGRGI